jgi:hypothetical protein
MVRKRKRGRGKTHVKNGCDEPVEKDNGQTNVGRSPPRDGKRRAIVGDLTPVEGEDAHGQAVGDTEQLVDLCIVGSHPAYPGEARESGEDIRREKVYENNESG